MNDALDDKLLRLTVSELIRNFSKYSDVALKEPIIITRNGRDRLVLVSVEEFGARSDKKTQADSRGDDESNASSRSAAKPSSTKSTGAKPSPRKTAAAAKSAKTKAAANGRAKRS
jgi:prevent-host-death family protein